MIEKNNKLLVLAYNNDCLVGGFSFPYCYTFALPYEVNNLAIVEYDGNTKNVIQRVYISNDDYAKHFIDDNALDVSSFRELNEYIELLNEDYKNNSYAKKQVKKCNYLQH